MWFFETLLPMSITGSILIIITLLTRPFQRRFRTYSALMLLWAAACLLLLLPFRLPLPTSIYNFASAEPLKQVFTVNNTLFQNNIFLSGNYNTYKFFKALLPAIPYVWLVGFVLCVLYYTASAVSLRKRFKGAVLCADLKNYTAGFKREVNIFMSFKTEQPVTYGILRPKIILPLSKADKIDEYIISHELQHIRDFDAALKLLCIALRCVHWFNPLVIAAVSIINKDIEEKCDYKVLAKLNKQHRLGYAQALADAVPVKKSGLTLLFGAAGIKTRIQKILSYHPATKRAAAAAFSTLFVCLLLFAANPVKSKISQEVAMQVAFAVPEKPTAAQPSLLLLKKDKALAKGYDENEVKEFNTYDEVSAYLLSKYEITDKIMCSELGGFTSKVGFGLQDSAGVYGFAFNCVQINIQGEEEQQLLLLDKNTYAEGERNLTSEEALNILTKDISFINNISNVTLNVK